LNKSELDGGKEKLANGYTTCAWSISPPLDFTRSRGTRDMNLYSYLADVVLIVHGLYVGFVLFGLLAILIGKLSKWNWIRNVWFRYVHLTMILIVTVEALLGIVCPLTTLENYLRGAAGQSVRSNSFMGQMVQSVLFYQAPAWMFTVAYCAFFIVVLFTLVIVPPGKSRSIDAADSRPNRR